MSASIAARRDGESAVMECNLFCGLLFISIRYFRKTFKILDYFLPTRLNISQACQMFGIFLPPLLRGIIMSEIPAQRDDILQIKMGFKTFDSVLYFHQMLCNV